MAARVKVFDTTLRDGEQSPGVALGSDEKLEIAAGLAALGVDVIEAGFPVTAVEEAQTVTNIARTVGRQERDGAPPPSICALARAIQSDIDAAWESVRHAACPRIHTFLATSPVHMKNKLGMAPEAVLERIRESVSYASSLCGDVEFSAEDATRSDPDFLLSAIAAALDAGATTINIPDTVGYATPNEFHALVSMVSAEISKRGQATLSVHCHDDLGLATANTLSGLEAGARQMEVTINGIGERAGNAALEEMVMILRTRKILGFDTGIQSDQLLAVSQLVQRATGMKVQKNKSIVGANAFAHESGIHQDGLIKCRETYEIMSPKSVGASGHELVLGKHSGRRALDERLQTLGYHLSEDDLKRVLSDCKDVSVLGHPIDDLSLQEIVQTLLKRSA